MTITVRHAVGQISREISFSTEPIPNTDIGPLIDMATDLLTAHMGDN